MQTLKTYPCDRSISESLPSRGWANFELCPGSQFGILMPSPLSLCWSQCPGTTSRNQTYKDATILEDKMASPLSPSWTSTRGPFDLILNAQLWQSCAPVIRRARRNRKISRSRSWSADSVNPLSWRRLTMKIVPRRWLYEFRHVGLSMSILLYITFVFLYKRRLIIFY
jgi:hypothetical protein